MPQNSSMAQKARTSLTSLERLERQLLPIRPSRAQGDAWEKALKGWINAGGHPELTKAWMWGEWPGKLKAGLKGDKGVGLVAETRDKQLVAIQVKFRENPNDPVTAPEVQKLVLTISNKSAELCCETFSEHLRRNNRGRCGIVRGSIFW